MGWLGMVWYGMMWLFEKRRDLMTGVDSKAYSLFYFGQEALLFSVSKSGDN
jgi:hypothetical protein